mgnify:CR=1|jgi:hypothetical protein
METTRPVDRCNMLTRNECNHTSRFDDHFESLDVVLYRSDRRASVM